VPQLRLNEWVQLGVIMSSLVVCQFEGESHEAAEYFEVASNHRPPRWWALCRDHAAFVRLALEPPNSNRLDVLLRQSEAGIWQIRVEERALAAR
jgi:hypothetical protein